MTGKFYKGMWIVNGTRCGEYLKYSQAIEKSESLNSRGYISFVEDAPFGTKRKYFVTVWKRGGTQ